MFAHVLLPPRRVAYARADRATGEASQKEVIGVCPAGDAARPAVVLRAEVPP